MLLEPRGLGYCIHVVYMWAGYRVLIVNLQFRDWVYMQVNWRVVIIIVAYTS